jgi:class 3 adenylate cyclase/tetratricopeptide (TPR) repeat protein
MDITAWLRSLSLQRYEQAFRENEINEAVLLKLTTEDLKELGVIAVGHRRILLDAIANLRGEASATHDEASRATEKSDGADNTPAEAERRQLTVMFCDLVGSTALSNRLDPEDLRSVIGAYHKSVAETVARFDGFVAKYMGDGVLIYFGYPQAHEDDAERAVRAGLALIEAIGKLHVQEPLQVRIGVATGVVVVGDLVGSGEAQERGVVGETPNLAARLQGIAAPNAVVVAESTRRLLGNLFELQDLGANDLKGISGLVRTWRALRASSVESRFEALHATGLAPLVGREEEFDLLLRRWVRARTGEGQVVLLSGESGIGKSRLTVALLERLATELHTRLRYFCSPQHVDSALYPIISQMERAAELARDDTQQAKLNKLDAVLAQTSTSIDDAALIAEMLSISNDGRYPTLGLTPQQRRERTLEALMSQLEALARQSPVLMIFEDAHWTDPTSLEVLGRVVNRIVTRPVLLIVTFRPEFEPPWIGQPHVTATIINRMTSREVGAMIDCVVGNKLLSAGIKQDIRERTDGIPLFVEEMTKAVLEAESEAASRSTVAAVPSPALAVPASLHASLMARLDRLGPAKEVAQIAAAIGREFSHAVLASVVRKSEADVISSLDRLVRAGLLFRQGAAPHATYLFKHALVRDAAYGTLLREPRRELHARIARTLNDNFLLIRDSQPEILAHHYYEAGLTEAAIEWWTKAGERAIGSCAYDEAIAHLEKAIVLAERRSDNPAQRLLRLQLQTMHGNALLHARGQTAKETAASFTRARELAAEVEDLTERASASYGVWGVAYVGADLTVMREVAETFLGDAARWPESPEAGFAHRLVASTRWFEGNYVDSRIHFERAVAVYDGAPDSNRMSRFSYDPGVVIISNYALTLWPLGDVGQATHSVERALSLAMQSGHIPSIAVAHYYFCLFEAIRRNPDQAEPHAEAILELGRKHGLPRFLAFGKCFVGWIRWRAGNRDGEAGMREGKAMIRELKFHLYEPLISAVLAEVEAEAGHLEEGLATLDAQLAENAGTGQRWFDAEVQRVRGELLLRRKPADVGMAEAALTRAVKIAQHQQTRTFELRAALSLAKLYHSTDRPADAHAVLASALDGFSPTSEFLEIAEAQTLLTALAP